MQDDLRKKILAVASSGGHWEQLMQISSAFEGGRVIYACTDTGQAERYNIDEIMPLKDYNANEKIKMVKGLVETFFVVRKAQPDVIISTGAAPGLLCLLWGRVFGAKTIWIDSIANSQKLSLSGRLAMKFCHVVFTQWEHLANDKCPTYHGSVL